MYHFGELWQIRYRASSRRQLVYKNYTYLRDATDNGFNHPKIQEGFRRQVAVAKDSALACGLPPATVRPHAEGGSSAKVTCSHCTSSQLHGLIRPNIGGNKSVCPLGAYPQKVAKEARLKITQAFHADELVLVIDAAFMKPHIDAAVTNNN